VTPEQTTAIYDAIHASETLTQMASVGNDSGITTQLNLSDDSILILKTSIPADYLRAMAIASLKTATGLGDQAKIDRWQAAVHFAAGFFGEIQLNDPILQSQLAQAQADGVLPDDIRDHYTKRIGCRAEELIGRKITVDEVSTVLLADRPNGKLV
jgi:hypothetical protein